MSTVGPRRPDETSVRATRQRDAVLETLEGCPEFVSAQELHHRMRRAGHTTGLTTVYRHLHRLADSGQVDVVVSPGDGALYRFCDSVVHHHHLVCRKCGLTVEVQGAEVERWADEAGHAHGFSELQHHVEIFGLCSRCATISTAP